MKVVLKSWILLPFFISLGVARVSAKESISYLALGDSYTIGEGVGDDQRWPVQLAAALRKKKIPVANPVIVARTGWTADELSAGIDQVKPQAAFGFVSMMIGTNNQFRGRSIDEYRQQFAALLKRAIAFAGGNADHVLVLSIPDWSVSPSMSGGDTKKTGEQINLFNSVNRQETQRAHARYVDITAQSRKDTSPTMFAEDGLHPSSEAYAAWVRLALPQAVEALSK